jgi:hypothetical protein
MMEPPGAVSRKEEREEDTLFVRLQEVAREPGDVYRCIVQSTDGEFIVILSDPDSGKEVCAWSGSADAIVVECQQWLAHRHAIGRDAR